MGFTYHPEDSLTLFSDEDRYLPSEVDLHYARVIMQIAAERNHRSLAREYAYYQKRIAQIEADAAEIGWNPWGLAEFAGPSPTPEEFFAYTAYRLRKDFEELMDSPYHPFETE